jgi:hypothetical protein
MNISSRIEEIINFYGKFGLDKTIKKYNISKITLKRYESAYRSNNKEGNIVDIKEEVLGDREKIKLKSDLKIIADKNKQLISDIAALETRNEIVDKLSQHIVQTYTIQKKSTKGIHEATAISVLSDVHAEEYVDPNTVNQLNSYNLDICKNRLSSFFERTLRLIEIQRNGVNINTLVIPLLGDLISGYIHEELVENNQLSPTEALLFVYDLVISGINFIVKEGKLKKIIIPCCDGNHGRTTDKIRVSTRYSNSYEWLMFGFLKKYYENSDVVEVIISNSYHLYLNIYDFPIRLHHGDSIAYGGGVGGITIPVNKAINEWNKSTKAYLDVFGHFHTLIWGSNFISNGSLIGYNPYALKIKAAYEKPQQAFFLIDETRGRTIQCPIFV